MSTKICAISLLSISIIVALVIGGLSGVPPVESKPNGVVAFMTDYGTKDFYVGAVKGVIYSTFPDARVIDITHEVTPFEVHEGAVTLWLAAREFPPGTVFVAVVDPGVGTERRAIAMETKNDLFFVAPDNGLLTLAMNEFGVEQIREVTNEEWMRLPVSYSFHGRDIFGPAGAHLAQGWDLSEAGPEVTDPVMLQIEPAQVEENQVMGQVLMVDQYGNFQANIGGGMLAEIGLEFGDKVSVKVNETEIESVFVNTYGDVPEGDDLIFVASTDLVEISINMGSAAEKFGAEIGSPVTITKHE